MKKTKSLLERWEEQGNCFVCVSSNNNDDDSKPKQIKTYTQEEIEEIINSYPEEEREEIREIIYQNKNK